MTGRPVFPTRTGLLLGTLWVASTPLAFAGTASSTSQHDGEFAVWSRGPAQILFTTDEIEALSGIATEASARAFIEWFWARRDPDPSTTINEFRAEFEERLGYVAKEFKGDGSTPAWGSARGQLYLLLGAPHAVFRAERRVAIDGAFRRPTVWQYEHSGHAPQPTRFAFVETRSGVRLLTHRGNDLDPQQQHCIETQRTKLVHPDQRRRFETPAEVPGGLPHEARSLATAEGHLADVSMALPDLYGHADEQGIRYSFGLAGRQAPSAADRATLSGRIDVLITADEYRNWSDQRLHLALWTPGEVGPIALIEGPTGRLAQLPAVANGSEALPIAIGRLLAITELPDGGRIVAYFPTCPEHHPDAEATLLVHAGVVEIRANGAFGARLAGVLPPQ